MFSLISPEHELALKEELFGCTQYIKIPMAELMKMPTRDRKFYIKKHNEEVDKENAEYEAMSNGNTTRTEAIDKFTDIDQATYSKMSRM